MSSTVRSMGLACAGPGGREAASREGGSRDDVMHEAEVAGLGLMCTQRITGLGMTAIMRILSDPPRPRL
jgi:hypothetical protein